MFWLEAMSVGTVLFAETEAGEYQEGWFSVLQTLEGDGNGGFDIDCWCDSEQWACEPRLAHSSRG